MWVAMFPGQGSQAIGMGRFYFDNFKEARHKFEEASDILKTDFKKLCFGGPEGTLTLTQNAQPAIFLVSCTAWFCLSREIDLSFIKYVAGHSVGEYSALVAGGALPFQDALKMVRQRGKFMGASTPKEGGMSALIGPTQEEALHFCKWVTEKSPFTLEVGAFNSLNQTILSGQREALSFAEQNSKKFPFKDKKVRLIPLKVSHAFHSCLMKNAKENMKQELDQIQFSPASKLYIPNVTAKVEADHLNFKSCLLRQITEPVLWLQTMTYLMEQGCSQFLELGHGTILAGLLKKISSQKKSFHFQSLSDLETLKN